MDCPGCDEFGSTNVDRIVEKCHNIASAYIFVTSNDCYRRKESSDVLGDLFKKDPGKNKDTVRCKSD